MTVETSAVPRFLLCHSNIYGGIALKTFVLGILFP